MKIKLLLLTLALYIPSLSYAEEAEPFFSKDYAKSPERDKIAPEQKPINLEPTTTSVTPRAVRTKHSDLTERVKELAGKARDSSSDNALPSRATPLPGSKQTMQVAVVGAILAATDQELLAKQLTDFIQIVSELNILISTIYCIGPRIELPNKTLYQITKYQGRILFVDELPEKYKAVTQSPTWILSSLDQEIIIEGAGLLSENLNVKGEITTRATEKVAHS